jgi:16S rRNA (cytosine967-C5)-methyltransferase
MGRKETARSLALDALKRVEKDRAYLDRVVDTVLAHVKISDADRRLFSELAYGTIRHQRLLDFYIEQSLDRKINQTDLPTRTLLRLGAYQIFFLDKIPPHAAVNETVELSVQYARPIINAVLRKLLREKETLKTPDAIPDPIRRLGVKYSHPDWMVKLFIARFGEEAEQALAANNERPGLTVRINAMRGSREELMALFKKEEVDCRPGNFCPLAVIISEHKYPPSLPGFKEGIFAVQDEASQLVVMMLDPQPGFSVLDACAAPGTKTLEIFQFMQKSGRLVSADVNETKLKLALAEAKRLGLGGFELLAQDLTEPLQLKTPALFDAVLVDAPCSGLGTIRHHPEIKWLRSPKDIAQLAELQKRLVKNLAEYVKPGGVLVYSTCTVTREENEEVVGTLIESGEFELTDPAAHMPESARALVNNNIFSTLPSRHGADGFTAFRLVRVR